MREGVWSLFMDRSVRFIIPIVILFSSLQYTRFPCYIVGVVVLVGWIESILMPLPLGVSRPFRAGNYHARTRMRQLLEAHYYILLGS
ncbi:hypothetical protein BJX76DRAFT_330645 [Aspergillus varians]